MNRDEAIQQLAAQLADDDSAVEVRLERLLRALVQPEAARLPNTLVDRADYDRVVAEKDQWRLNSNNWEESCRRAKPDRDAAQAEVERLRRDVAIYTELATQREAERDELRKIVEAVARIACDNEQTSPNRLDAIVSVVGRRAK